jgi:hypothetical protein
MPCHVGPFPFVALDAIEAIKRLSRIARTGPTALGTIVRRGFRLSHRHGRSFPQTLIFFFLMGVQGKRLLGRGLGLFAGISHGPTVHVWRLW